MEHYLDDFITVGRPGSLECQENLGVMLKMCEATGTPIDPGKMEGPCTTLVFLGIEVNTVAMQLRLPREKLVRLNETLKQWRARKCCRKRDLLSLIGVLSHACKVVRPGRSFMRRLFDLGKVVKHLDHFVQLNKEARSDIEWWFLFAEQWNGVSFMYEARCKSWEVAVMSDVSGRWGCGAFSEREWFQLRWPEVTRELHITVKELIPIVLAAAVWGKEWKGKCVMSYCDNAAVVAIINKGDSKEPEAMHLVRGLAFLKAKFQFCLVSSHIKGINNGLADALSRDNVHSFLSHYSQAHPTPTHLPPELLDLTMVTKPDWTSRAWTDLWRATFGRD